MGNFAEKELFSPDFSKNIAGLEKIQEIKVNVDSQLEKALSDYESIKKQIGEIKTETVLECCKETVVANLCQKFAINSLIAQGDKDGGSVTTLHNAKNKVFANESDKKQFNRDYNANAYHDGNEKYRQRKSELNQLSAEGNLHDSYTGKNILGKEFIVDKNGNAREQSRFDVEHFESAKSIHDRDDVRLFMTEEQSTNMANSKENLGATASSINRSKGDSDFDDWKNKKRPEFDNKTNEELYGIDAELADKKIAQSRQFINHEVRKAKFRKYSRELAKTGLEVGGKTFLYSAIGQISLEFIRAAFDALIEAFKSRHTKTLSEILDIFKSHIRDAVKHIKENWKEILANSLEGALMNFLNNLLVSAINLVATTLKNVVNIIRTGFTTVCSAIKLLCNPPKDMSAEERNDAVCKLLVFGITEVAAISLNECVEKLLMTLGVPENITDALVYPFTAFMGGIVAAIIIGIMQKARNDAKKSKLHVTLIAQGNVAIQAQIVQNWCILAQGEQVLKMRANDFDRRKESIEADMASRERCSEAGLDETDSILEQIKRI